MKIVSKTIHLWVRIRSRFRTQWNNCWDKEASKHGRVKQSSSFRACTFSKAERSEIVLIDLNNPNQVRPFAIQLRETLCALFLFYSHTKHENEPLAADANAWKAQH